MSSIVNELSEVRASSPSHHGNSLNRRPSNSINGKGDGGSIDIPMVPAVDAAALIASTQKPNDAQIELQALKQEEEIAVKETSGENAAAHMSTEYLEYLNQLSKAWSDCPAVEIAFDGLQYKVRNDATIADAKVAKTADLRKAKSGADGVSTAPTASEENIPNLAKAALHLALTPSRLVQAGYRAAAGVQPDPEEVLQSLAPCSGVIRPGTMTLILAPPGAGKKGQAYNGMYACDIPIEIPTHKTFAIYLLLASFR
jgi:hypothetical protein